MLFTSRLAARNAAASVTSPVAVAGPEGTSAVVERVLALAASLETFRVYKNRE